MVPLGCGTGQIEGDSLVSFAEGYCVANWLWDQIANVLNTFSGIKIILFGIVE